MSANWEDTTREILERLDIAAEYASLGVEFDWERVSRGGWRACHAMGREDRSASAAVNVGDWPLRGRYRDLGGTAESLSLFDFAAKYGTFGGDWKEARREFAKKAGVKLPSGQKGPKDFEEQISFESWNDNLVTYWCETHKRGVTPAAFRDAGGRLGKLSKKAGEHIVVALPVYGKHLTASAPCGWVLWHRGGRDLPVYQGKGQPPKMVKMKTLAGSVKGWMGRTALENLAEADVVWKVEGPGDMLALSGIIPPELAGKHVVITNSDGCSAIPDDAMVAHLEGKTVYVLHDADNPGQGILQDEPHRLSGARLWCNEIARVAHEVRNVQLPFAITEKHGRDVRDWVNEGATYDHFLQRAAIADVVTHRETGPRPPAGNKPPTSDIETSDVGSFDPGAAGDGLEASPEVSAQLSKDQEICAGLQIDVLGELPSGRIRVHSFHLKKSTEIRDIGRMSYEQLLQIAGQPARTVINKTDEHIEGQYTLGQIREAIAMLASYRSIVDGEECGVGVWRGRHEGGDENESLVLVGAGEAARLNGDGKLKRVSSPRVDGLLLNFNSRNEWYQFGKLAGFVERAHADPQWVRETINETVDLFSRWEWRNPEVDPTTLTGLVVASWVQTVWKWRPLVAVAGTSNSGKSSLLSCLGGEGKDRKGLFGALALLSSQSSEAGIRQAIKHDAVVVLCDEFEDSRDRAKVLNLFRTSGRGSKVLKGTAGQGGESFGLQHIPWVAAIEVGLDREPDRNRFIMFELLPPPAERYGKLNIPSEEWLVEHGQKLLAIALTFVRQAAETAQRIKSTTVQGIDKRVIESYAVPASILGTCRGFDDQTIIKLMNNMLTSVDKTDQGQSDADTLFDDIVTSPIKVGNGVERTISQIIESENEIVDRLDIMAVHGVGITVDEITLERSLFISPRAVKRTLLKGSQWVDQRIDMILGRIPNAKKTRKQLAGAYPRGVEIPMAWIRAHNRTETEKSGHGQELGGMFGQN